LIDYFLFADYSEIRTAQTDSVELCYDSGPAIGLDKPTGPACESGPPRFAERIFGVYDIVACQDAEAFHFCHSSDGMAASGRFVPVRESRPT
jgi:hypothetical protein